MWGTNTIFYLSNIFKCKFGPNGGVPKYGGAIYKKSYVNTVFIVLDSEFYGLKAVKGGALYGEAGYDQINIYNSTFIGNEAMIDGGAIYYISVNE